MSKTHNAATILTLSVIVTVSFASQDVFAHSSTIIDGPTINGVTKEISLVLGHSNEPTYGKKAGIHDGKHSVDVFVRDTATHLDLSGAELSVDKFYFDSQKSFQDAKTLSDATETMSDVSLGEVHGDPGHYSAYQLHSAGIYGYHVFGTINYFGIADVDIDITLFCKNQDFDTSKFNVGQWSGGFGCTENIDDTAFPKKQTP